jgi:hypothetical protein
VPHLLQQHLPLHLVLLSLPHPAPLLQPLL